MTTSPNAAANRAALAAQPVPLREEVDTDGEDHANAHLAAAAPALLDALKACQHVLAASPIRRTSTSRS